MSSSPHMYGNYGRERVPASRRRRRILALGLLAGVAAASFALIPEAGHENTRTENGLEVRALALPGTEIKPVKLTRSIDRMAPAPAEIARPSDSSDREIPHPVAAHSSEPAEPEQGTVTWARATVKRGDTLAAIFSRHGLGPEIVHRVVNSSKLAQGLSKIRPGQTLRLGIEEGKLLALVHEHDAVSGLRVERDGDAFKAESFENPVETRTSSASGIIDDSLYQSAQDAGLSDRVIIQMADLFGYDVDFGLDIREGDSFTVLFEEQYLDGEKYRDGEIIAAEFVNQGRTIQAYRFVDEDGRSKYYSPDGRSMRKAFLRSPMEFARISSRFTKRRWHPVLKKWRAHKGVDYAAPMGTPIRSTGEGRVSRIGWIGGYGKAIMIQHGKTYTTVYGHMSRFARGMKKGSRVSQGQTIGYVGKTGYATGPHLHYEFRVKGAHKNPLTVQLPMAEPIPAKYADEFRRDAKVLSARLEQHRRVVVARAD